MASDLDVELVALESSRQPAEAEAAAAPVLDDWYLTRSAIEAGEFVAKGIVSGSTKLPDGDIICTSRIRALDDQMRWVRTKNTLYKLGVPQNETTLILRAAARKSWRSAWHLVATETGTHTLSEEAVAAALAVSDFVAMSETTWTDTDWSTMHAACGAVADVLQQHRRTMVAAAWLMLSADIANLDLCRRVAGIMAGVGKSGDIISRGWDQLALGRAYPLDERSDTVAAAHAAGRRALETAASIPTDALRELAIDVDAPTSGVVVLEKVGGTQESQTAKEAVREFQAIAGKRLPFALVPTDMVNVRATLRDEFPHATAQIDVLLSGLAAGNPVRMKNTLLAGPPGCGKSRLAVRVAECLMTPLHRFDGAGASDNTFGGTPRRWSSGEHCVPLEAMRRHRIANPILLIDEIDKAGSGRNNGNLENSLMPFLGGDETSRAYPDPYVQAECNLSFVNFMLTANDDAVLSDPLRDRLRIIRLPKPGIEHLPAIARSIVNDIAADSGEDTRWVADLDDGELAVAEGLWRGGSVRRLRAIVERILAYREQRPRN